MTRNLTRARKNQLIRGTFQSPPCKDRHRNWYRRGYLPHIDRPGLIQIVTFRLADALPSKVLQRMESELRFLGGGLRTRVRMVERYLDAGYGSCYLREPRIAHLVEEALLFFDKLRYLLSAWVIMPNHCHVMYEPKPGWPLPGILHSWKSYTAKRANDMLGRQGRVWQKEFHDRFIRDAEHFFQAIRYIHENPVKAGLVEHAEDWKFSSAAPGRRSWLEPRWEVLSKDLLKARRTEE